MNMQDTINKSHFSDSEIRAANVIRDLLDSAYNVAELGIRYYKNHIQVNVSGNIKNSSLNNEVQILCKTNKYSVVKLDNGVSIKIKRGK